MSPNRLWRRFLASGHKHCQGPNTQLKAFIGKGKLTEKWPLDMLTA